MDIREYIRRLEKRFNTTIRVACNTQTGIGRRRPLSEHHGPIDYRVVLPNEIPFDVDSHDWCVIRDYGGKICATLTDEGVPFDVVYTAGKGVHIRFFFEVSEEDKRRLAESGVTMRNVRKVLHTAVCAMAGIPKRIHLFNLGFENRRFLAKGALCNELKACFEAHGTRLPPEAMVFENDRKWTIKAGCEYTIEEERRKGDGCRYLAVYKEIIGPGRIIDTFVVGWDDDSQGWLIREIGGAKLDKTTRKFLGYAMLLDSIPETRPSTLDVDPRTLVYPEIRAWPLPPELVTKIIAKIKAYKPVETANLSIPTGEHLSLPCVQNALKGLKDGARNEGARLVAIACSCDRLPWEEALDVAEAYWQSIEHTDIAKDEIIRAFRWAYRRDAFWGGRTCGCGQRIGICGPQCKFRIKPENLRKTTLAVAEAAA